MAAWQRSVSAEADGRWPCCSVPENALGKCQVVVDSIVYYNNPYNGVILETMEVYSVTWKSKLFRAQGKIHLEEIGTY